MRSIVAFAALLVLATPGLAREACTLILRPADNQILYQSGSQCDAPYSPASTFKLTLALIGFDSGLLEGPYAPRVAYDATIDAQFEVWRRDTTPKSWLKNSVVWYSQWLTNHLGMAAFQAYIDRLDYGNRDLSGDPGKGNGLTHAWLGSSLRITPHEQATYLARIWRRDLDLSEQAFVKLNETAETFQTADPGLRVLGKTGTTWLRDAQGHRTASQVGWFVGWTQEGAASRIFVRLFVEENPPKGYAGGRAKASMLADLPVLLRP